MPALNPNNLFDFIKMIFIPKEYNSLYPYQKIKHGFMLNRFMSKNYPIQAAILNKIGINLVEVVNFWAKVLQKSYTSTPGWMFIKGKKAQAKLKKEYIPEDETILMFCKMNNCTRKEINEAKIRWPEELEAEFKKIEKLRKYQI